MSPTVKVRGHAKTNVDSCEPAVSNALEDGHNKMDQMQIPAQYVG